MNQKLSYVENLCSLLRLLEISSFAYQEVCRNRIYNTEQKFSRNINPSLELSAKRIKCRYAFPISLWKNSTTSPSVILLRRSWLEHDLMRRIYSFCRNSAPNAFLPSYSLEGLPAWMSTCRCRLLLL